LDGGVEGSEVNAFAVLQNGDLVVGGIFTAAGGMAVTNIALWRSGCQRGDLNCDDSVNSADVPFFVTALLDPANLSGCNITLADFNTDGLIDGDDMRSFVNI